MNLNFKYLIMKKLYSLIALACLLLLGSCGGDDPKSNNEMFSLTLKTLNHIVDLNTGTVLAPTIGSHAFKVNLNTSAIESQVTHTIPGVGAETFSMSVSGANPSYGIYTFSGGTGAIGKLRGLIDLNEDATRLSYVVNDRYRVIATLPEVFFLATNTKLTYSDGTSSMSDGGIYQFEIDPANLTATIIVTTINHTKDVRYIKNITGKGATVEPTEYGYHITAENLATITNYQSGDFEKTNFVGYPLITFDAKLDVVNGTMTVNFKMGRTEVTEVSATGTVYKDNTLIVNAF